uniref:Rho/rac guanine nucleotide exchange factor (GEF) 18a n=1 Tax=Oncorhynchus kisutch TaxID=8019 RepID=A0A8C7KV54_ONCKI
MDDLDAVRGLSPRPPPPEDSVSFSSSSTDIINLDDGHYSALLAELEADAQDLEGESWSVSVDQQYIKRLHKDAIKRQDVIYELIQTEVYHMQTLKLLLSVYQYELRRNLQMEETRLDRMFPQVTHGEMGREFIPDACCLPDHYHDDRMKESYGDCCSHHTDAVSFYKEQLQNNKKFQNLITKIGRLSIVRQLGVPECILLVTQRLAKYPFLVERILQNTDADSEEHDALAHALVLIRETISAVDSQVHDYERASWLRDIGSSLEPHSCGRLKDGRVFKREDLAVGSRNLLHEGTVNWQAANRWLKGDLKRNSQIQNYCSLAKHTVEEQLYSEQEEARLNHLCMKDAQIMQSLTEKLRMFADMAEAVTGLEDVANHSRLLLRSDDLDPQQGETLLKGAITEETGSEAYTLWQMFYLDLICIPGILEPFVYLAVICLDSCVHLKSCNWFSHGYSKAATQPYFSLSPQFFDRVLLLSQKLYSLLAIVSQQDSHIELQRASLSEREHPGRPRGNVLLEQEKQRNMEKQREEMANFHKLQTQHRLEQARWEEEQECHQLQAEVLEAELRHREEECRRLKEKLAEERGELERWRETYQQDLERLRESTRTVEKQKERLDLQMKLKKNKTIAKPGSFNFNTQQVGWYSEFHSVIQFLYHPEYTVLPEVHTRDSISPAPPKAEVPIHLISTTNQVVHKPGAVQQQIPTKLATLSSKGKEKSRKKGSHQRMHSAGQNTALHYYEPSSPQQPPLLHRNYDNFRRAA